VQFERAEEAGVLTVEWTGLPLDLYAMGVLEINLQEIVDKVVYRIAAQERIVPSPFMRPSLRGLRPDLPYPRFLRAEIRTLSTGSLSQEVVFLLAAVLSDPTMRAVLSGVASNIVYAIGVSALKGVISRPERPPRRGLRSWQGRPDPIDIGPNLRAVALALAQNGSQAAELRVTADGPEGKTQVVIRIEDKQ